MPRLTEEMSLVGGNAIDHHGTLVLLIGLRDKLVVVLHVAESQKAQTPGEAASQQSVLMSGEPNPRLPVDQLLKLGEQTRSQRGTVVHLTLPVRGSVKA